MSYQMNLWDTPNATSSPALAYGATHYVEQDGPTIVRSGPHPALASLSARKAKALGLLTSGTFGPTSTTSSASAALESSLVSRLRARTQTHGSTLYRLTWKPWVMPSGRSRFRLRASVRRTSATGSTGWVTPTTRDWKDTPGMSALRDGEQRLDQLPRQAYLVTAIRRTAHGESLTGSCAATESGGQLNPAHSRWLMGLPPAWDACAVTAMRSMQKQPKPSSKP